MRNRLIKVLCALLSMLLLTSLFAVNVLAEEEIGRVDIAGVQPPVSGEEPDREAASDTDGTEVTSVVWLYSTTPGLNTFREISGRFGQTPYYAVRVSVAANEGYIFAEEPVCHLVGQDTPIISGVTVSEDRRSLEFTYVFGKVIGVLSEVSVTGFRAPLPGEEPCKPSELTVSSGMVADQIIWNEQGQFNALGDHDVFEEGKVYEATVWLKSDGSAIVTADTVCSVGKLECAREYWDESSLCVKLTIPCEKAGETVLSIEVIKDPDKTAYTVGETLDLRGIVVRITTTDGYVDAEDGARLTASPTLLDRTGTETITLECEGVKTTFDVIVVPRKAQTVATVRVADIVDPVAGRKANNSFTLTTDPESAVVADGKAGSFWYWFDDSFSYVPFTGRFEAGQKYALFIPLEVREGFELTSDALFTINGTRCVIQVGQDGELVMVRYYDELRPSEQGDFEIDKVEVKGVTIPERGKMPTLNGIEVPAEAEYEITEIGWVIEQNGTWITTSDPFAVGHYGLRVVLHADDQAVFADPAAYLNGEKADAVCTVSGKLVTVIYDVCRLAGSDDPVNPPVVTDPQQGEQTEPESTDETRGSEETKPSRDKASRFPVFPLILVILLAIALGVAVFFLLRKQPEDEE